VVSVGKLKAGHAKYYLDQVEPHPNAAAALASGAEDYYVGGTESAGQWQGRGAAELGLTGSVDGPQLHAVLAGQHPTSGAELRRAGSVAAFDVTFSAPKSASLLFGIGDPEVQAAVRAAHERAVADAFAYFEQAVSVARRGAGGVRTIAGDGLTAAAFLHRTSRAGDPQLHTHVVVANLIRGTDGRWSALDGRRVYAHARTAGYLYQAALRAELTRELGVRWRPVRKGMAEIDGVREKALRAFSRRRAEIEDAMKRRGSSGRDAAQIAALATRRVKDRAVRPEQLVGEWRERAARHGLDLRMIDRIRRRGRLVESPDWNEVFAALAGPTGLTRNRSTFGRRDVLQALSSAAADGAPVHELTLAANTFLNGPYAIRLLGATRDAEAQYSTPELLAIESRVLDAAASLRGAVRGTATPEAVDAAIDRRPFLSDEQREMVQRLTKDGDGVAVVLGLAGAGKTTALAAARDAWEQAGVPVRGCAVARRAARELDSKAGLRATSVAGLLRRQRALTPGAVLVVDEAGMLGTRDLEKLLTMVADARGKLVLTGDPSQLPAIEAGGALRALSTRLDPIVLRNNRRQQLAWEREAVEALRIGEGDRALELYEKKGRLHIGRTDDEVLRKLVADWSAHRDPDETVMIAHRRADVAELNARARAVMRATGQLGPDELIAGGAGIAVADRILVKRNDSRCDVRNGDRGVITAIDAKAGALQVRFGDRSAMLDGRFLSQPTQSGRPALEHGYAITAYASQGMTCRHALVLARDDAYREWIYTTMTRASRANSLYVVGERPRGREEFAPEEPALNGRVLLAAALTRSNADELAIERLLPEREAGRSIGRD
jgi:conjugative relaxase-like TrwC/TraI family protein